MSSRAHSGAGVNVGARTSRPWPHMPTHDVQAPSFTARSLQTFTDPVTFVEKLIERYVVRWGTWAGGPGPGEGVHLGKGVDQCQSPDRTARPVPTPRPVPAGQHPAQL